MRSIEMIGRPAKRPSRQLRPTSNHLDSDQRAGLIFGCVSTHWGFLALQRVVGLVKPLHHDAGGRVADQITTFPDRIDR